MNGVWDRQPGHMLLAKDQSAIENPGLQGISEVVDGQVR